MQSIGSITGACKTALVLLGSVLASCSVASGQSRSDQSARSEDSPKLRVSPQVIARTNVEQYVELEGTLEVLQEDHANGARLRHFLYSGGTWLSLQFAGRPPGLLTGDRVRVRGMRLGDTLALQSGTTSLQAVTATAVLTNSIGEQRTLVLLVNFQDDAVQPYTPNDARDVVFATTSNFDREGSYQQTWLTGDVFGWFTIAMSHTVCDMPALTSLADQAAAAAGVNTSLYTRHVYAFPRNACSWTGMGTIGGNPSHAWINGDLTLKVVAHEMGHNFGLYHAHALDCGSSAIVPPCTWTDYGDTLDIMGNTPGHFDAFNKERLGWLGSGGSPPIATVQTSGTYWLEPLESAPGGGAKALKILRSTDPTTGARTWYYVESRQGIGFDSFLGSNALNGVVIRTGTESDGNSGYLLDMTPETDDWTDPALDAGLTFTDTTAGVTVTTTSVSRMGASVTVTLSGPPCTRGNPTVTLSPPTTQSLKAGTMFSYTLSVRSTDSETCTAAAFSLAAAAPGAWTSVFASPTLTISPGSSASTTMHVTSAAAAADGVYAISAAAINGADVTKSGSAFSTYTVLSLTVQISTSQTSYTRSQTVTISATVLAGAAPASGASIVFTIIESNGVTINSKGTTDTNGAASYAMRLKPRVPVGVYRVNVTVFMNGLSGSGTTSFSVK